jgi:hypothetical protein
MRIKTLRHYIHMNKWHYTEKLNVMLQLRYRHQQALLNRFGPLINLILSFAVLN